MRLPGMHLAQLVVELEAVVDRVGVIKTFPVGQDMRGDEVDRRGELRMVDPDRPDFASGDRDRALPLHLLDELDQVVDGHLGAQRGFVADDDGVDVAVMAGEIERRADFALVALLVLVDPGADRDLQAEFGGDRRHQLGAAGRRIGADGARIGRDSLQIGTDLFGGGALTSIGVRRIRERGVGDARELTGEIRRNFFRFSAATTARHARTLQARAQLRRCASTFNHAGRRVHGPEPVPKVRRWS